MGTVAGYSGRARNGTGVGLGHAGDGHGSQ